MKTKSYFKGLMNLAFSLGALILSVAFSCIILRLLCGGEASVACFYANIRIFPVSLVSLILGALIYWGAFALENKYKTAAVIICIAGAGFMSLTNGISHIKSADLINGISEIHYSYAMMYIKLSGFGLPLLQGALALSAMNKKPYLSKAVCLAGYLAVFCFLSAVTVSMFGMDVSGINLAQIIASLAALVLTSILQLKHKNSLD